MPERLPALLAPRCRAPVPWPGSAPALADVTCSTQPQVKHKPQGWRWPHQSQLHAARIRSWPFLCSLTLKSKLLYVFSHKKSPETFCPAFPNAEISLQKLKPHFEVSWVEELLSLP